MNQFFTCTRCHHVDLDDLATSEAIAAKRTPTPFICTKCLTGTWHNQFKYLPYDPTHDKVCNPPLPAIRASSV